MSQAVDYWHQKGDPGREAQAREDLADACFTNISFNDSVPERISQYEHARSLYLQGNQPIPAAGALTHIAAHLITLKQFDLAEKDLQQSLAEYKVAGYKKLQYVYMTRVDLEYARGNYYRSERYCFD